MSPAKKEWYIWLSRNMKVMTDHMLLLANRYAFAYVSKYQTPIGRPLAYFMMWWNKKKYHAFSNEEINWWYYY